MFPPKNILLLLHKTKEKDAQTGDNFDFNPFMVVLSRLKMNTGDRLRPPSDRFRTKAPKRVTNKDRQQAVELYLTGLSLRQVSEQVGVSRHVVKAAVKKAEHEIWPKKRS